MIPDNRAVPTVVDVRDFPDALLKIGSLAAAMRSEAQKLRERADALDAAADATDALVPAIVATVDVAPLIERTAQVLADQIDREGNAVRAAKRNRDYADHYVPPHPNKSQVPAIRARLNVLRPEVEA